jgi:CRISPR-associated protein Csb2
MFAIAVELLCSRYTATHFNDRSRAEWPPHPARLFSAMTAAWADADEPDPAERAAMQWLESQPPPAVSCSQARCRSVVQHFVPVNDATALTRDISRTYSLVRQAQQDLVAAEQGSDERGVQHARSALARAEAGTVAAAQRVGAVGGGESLTVMSAVLEILPENRGKQGRTYPSVIPDDPTFWFSWPDATPTKQHLAALDRLLGRVGRLGHSSTLVACRFATTAPAPTWVAGAGDSTVERLRVPRAGLIDRLEQAYQSHQGSEPRQLPAAMIGYRRPSTLRHKHPVPLLGGDWIVLGIQGGPLGATQIREMARAVRGALLVHSTQPVPSVMSGHRAAADGQVGRTVPLEGPHMAVVPLPNAGHRQSNGSVLGIALVLPAECADEDREAVEQAVAAWSVAGFDLAVPAKSGSAIRRKLTVVAVDRALEDEPAWLNSDLAERRRTMTRNYWCGPARRWLTVTPIALDRFPGDLRERRVEARERADAEARTSITRACAFAGLPGNPIVSIRLDSPLSGLPAAPLGRGSRGRSPNGHYPGYQTGGGIPRACVHAEIEFDIPVLGPVLIGAGRYLGYGLCLPSDSRSAGQP